MSGSVTDAPDDMVVVTDTEPQDAEVIRLEAERHLAAAEQARQTAAAKTQERDAILAELARLDEAEAAREQRLADERARALQLQAIASGLVKGTT